MQTHQPETPARSDNRVDGENFAVILAASAASYIAASNDLGAEEQAALTSGISGALAFLMLVVRRWLRR